MHTNVFTLLFLESFPSRARLFNSQLLGNKEDVNTKQRISSSSHFRQRSTRSPDATLFGPGTVLGIDLVNVYHRSGLTQDIIWYAFGPRALE